MRGDPRVPDASAEPAVERDPGTSDGEPDGPPVWAREAYDVVGEYRIFRVRQDWARSPRTGDVLDFYVLEMPPWVQVVPVVRDGRFIMVEQYRHGRRQVTLEFPAGIVEPDEEPAQCAVRELEEETGYRAGRCEVLGTVDPNPALQDNRMTLVAAWDCEPLAERDQDQREDVRVRLVEPEAVPRLIAEGRISDAFGITAWFFFQQRQARD